MELLNKIEGKNLDELKVKSGISFENIIYKTEEKEGGLFKSKKVIVYYIEKEKIIESLSNFLNKFGKKMGFDINFEIKEDSDIFNINIFSSSNAILIGKEGITLNSIQKIIRQFINNRFDLSIKVNVDISNYKQKKIKNLEYQVKNLIKDVLKSGVEAKIGPLNSFERKQVHTIVSEYSEILTESVGEEPNRSVIIKKA